VRFSAPNPSDAIKNLLANKRRLLKFKYFLHVRIDGDKRNQAIEDTIRSDGHPRYKIEGRNRKVGY